MINRDRNGGVTRDGIKRDVTKVHIVALLGINCGGIHRIRGFRAWGTPVFSIPQPVIASSNCMGERRDNRAITYPLVFSYIMVINQVRIRNNIPESVLMCGLTPRS
jgi:hypothetical protein